ncbi:unnamed protein product [Cuscuta campestris]|uniref:Mechanosensitive ion channel protein n=1 Tax=Cuscuta campestris TaxID=132261 RepID=A0A484M8J8_9ASTE|nr:unnamed protein product [Cuscuta campestris]
MDANGKYNKDPNTSNGEQGTTDNNGTPNDHVVVMIHGGDGLKDPKAKPLPDSPNACVGSPEIVTFSPTANKPPRPPPTPTTLTRRKSLARSVYSKPKSRFGEQPVPIDPDLFDNQSDASARVSPSNRPGPDGTCNTQRETRRTVSVSITPKTPLMASPVGNEEEDENEEIYKKVKVRNNLRLRKVKMRVLSEWSSFLFLLGCLAASLTIHKLRSWKLWDLELWKWITLFVVTFNGLLVTKWFIHFLALLIELNFLLRKRVLYFVYSLKKTVRVCLWVSLILVTWVSLFKNGTRRSRLANRNLDYITWTIASLLLGSCLWLLKTLLLKILASSFHVNAFFDRIQLSFFHQYILLTLSGAPVMESAEMFRRTNSNVSQLNFHRTKKGKDGKEKKRKVREVININKLHQMKREKVSAWTMKMLVDVISNTGLSTISASLDEGAFGREFEPAADTEITNEEEAIAAAYHIFRNVAQPGSKYIDEYDLARFLIKEEVDMVLPMIDVAETGEVDKKTLTEWVVKVYKDRKMLSHALNDTKTAVRQLNKLVTGILVIVIIIIWLLLVGIATTKVLVFLSSQLVVAAFMFGNTCKTVFEAIVFVFVMHPFDVGDRCVVDGVQMTVEEMNILTTIFLRFDNEKIYYPNSVLATKPISNFKRSPDMSDSFEFSIDFRTHVEKIGALNEKVQKYLEKSPLWYPNHNMVVKEIESMNKMKMALFFNHKMNFQNYGEKNRRRTELILEMKKMFEDLSIKYDLLPQEVHIVESSKARLS